MKLKIDSSKQMAELWNGSELIKKFIISTAKNGLGCSKGSDCTPTGTLLVMKKIGDDLPLGAVLKARVPTGEVWSKDPSNPLSLIQDDLVLTRVLWLGGAENHNANTLERYIYLHGTNQEHLLGTPVSHGCIRFSNQDISELYDLLPEGCEVLIS